MKHQTLLWANGQYRSPNVVAELGPGESLGTGLAALLSGANEYYALDIEAHSNTEENLRVLDELVQLFKSRANGSVQGWPRYDNHLDDDLFPGQILTPEVLSHTLSPTRVDDIRAALQYPGERHGDIIIEYAAPWSSSSALRSEYADLIFSQSVLEHVDDLESTYHCLNSWLKPDGIMSHQIDLTSHGLSDEWNGFRSFSEFSWTILVGRRPFLINRIPYSGHRRLLQSNGFEVVHEMQKHRSDGVNRARLARRWKDLSDDDLTCSGAFVQARKKTSGNEQRSSLN